MADMTHVSPTLEIEPPVESHLNWSIVLASRAPIQYTTRIRIQINEQIILCNIYLVYFITYFLLGQG